MTIVLNSVCVMDFALFIATGMFSSKKSSGHEKYAQDSYNVCGDNLIVLTMVTKLITSGKNAFIPTKLGWVLLYNTS